MPTVIEAGKLYNFTTTSRSFQYGLFVCKCGGVSIANMFSETKKTSCALMGDNKRLDDDVKREWVS